MIFSKDFFDEELRRALRLQVQLTVPPEFVAPVVDLACHAVEQSLDALERVAFDTADARVSITVTSLAVSLMIHRLTHMEQVMERAASDHGMPVHHGTVSVQR